MIPNIPKPNQLQPQSTIFKFPLDNQQLFTNLDHIKLNDYNKFLRIGQLGKQVQSLSKANQHQQLQKLLQKHSIDIPFIKLEIQDAFISAFHLRNQQTIEYYLKNGIDVDQLIPDAVISILYTLEYLGSDPPITLLTKVLQYGGNPRYAASDNSDTPIHIACKYGNLEFVKILVQFKCDINAVNDQKMTPLGIALAKKKKDVVEYLRSLNASEKWNT